jgi:hypothetical protein
MSRLDRYGLVSELGGNFSFDGPNPIPRWIPPFFNHFAHETEPDRRIEIQFLVTKITRPSMARTAIDIYGLLLLTNVRGGVIAETVGQKANEIRCALQSNGDVLPWTLTESERVNQKRIKEVTEHIRAVTSVATLRQFVYRYGAGFTVFSSATRRLINPIDAESSYGMLRSLSRARILRLRAGQRELNRQATHAAQVANQA